MMDCQAIIREIGRGAKGARALDATRAEQLGLALLDGEVGELELGAILMALRIKSESTEELLGFKRALDARVAQIRVPAGPACVVLPSYNGARRQANLMPLLALLLAREGVPVLIHGCHDFPDRSDSFALLEQLGVPRQPGIAEAEAALAQQRIAAVDIALIAPGLSRLLALRRRMGVRGTAHILAKLIDPCRQHSLRVVAVTHPEYLVRMRDFLRADGGMALLLRATEGEGYANPRRRPQMLAFADGCDWEACAAEPGGAPPLPDFPDDPALQANAGLIRSLLDGQRPLPEPIREQVAMLLALARGELRPSQAMEQKQGTTPQ